MTRDEVTHDTHWDGNQLPKTVCVSLAELDDRLDPVLFAVESPAIVSETGNLRMNVSEYRSQGAPRYSPREGFDPQSALDSVSNHQLRWPSSEGYGLGSFLSILRSADKQLANDYRYFVTDEVFRSNGWYVWVLRLNVSAWRQSGVPPLVTALVEVICHALANADRGFRDTSPQWMRLGPREFLRRAAAQALRSIARDVLGDDLAFEELFHHLSAIAGERYERSEAWSFLAVSREICEASRVSLETPVPFSRHRRARKVLQMSSESCPVVANAEHIVGLSTPEKLGRVLLIRILGHHRWSVEHDGLLLFEVVAGVPRLARGRFDSGAFEFALNRLSFDPSQFDAVREIAEAAVVSRLGATIVVSADAESEAVRLGEGAFRIAPVHLPRETLASVLAIDGALLLDCSARCHALGAILDGIAAPERENPTRGSRYNSAVRYVVSQAARAVALVVSSDGYTDIIDGNPV